MIFLSNLRNHQTKYRYSIKNDDDVNFPLANIRKMKNTTKAKMSAIDIIVLLTKAAIGRRKLNVCIRKV